MKLLNVSTADKAEKEGSIYIGRGTPLGNPFPGSTYGRLRAVELYRERLYTTLCTYHNQETERNSLCEENQALVKAFYDLKLTDTLLCHCVPLLCRGHCLIEFRELFPNGDSTGNIRLLKDREIYRKLLLQELYEECQTAGGVYSADGLFRMFHRLDMQEVDIEKIVDRTCHLWGRSGMCLSRQDAYGVVSWLSPYLLCDSDGKKPNSESSVVLEMAIINQLAYDFQPHNDGKDHINIYSGGKTALGRALSNFSSFGFELTIGRVTHRFKSMEGFWYWLSTGMQHDELQSLVGFEAKKFGRTLKKVPVANFEIWIKRALNARVEQNPELADKLRESKLPFTHYYVFKKDGEQVRFSVRKYEWLAHWHEVIRNRLQGKAHSLAIVGSRSFSMRGVMNKELMAFGRSAIYEIISGGARGADKMAIDWAIDNQIPYTEILAEWDRLGDKAGFERNTDIVKSATAVIAFWDGESRGTKDTIKKARAASWIKELSVVLFAQGSHLEFPGADLKPKNTRMIDRYVDSLSLHTF